jgi:RNA polymerase sigma factor (sigma-70 family)
MSVATRLTYLMDLTDRHELLRAAVSLAPELRRYFKRRVGHDAQDLLQELYLALLKIPGAQPVVRHPQAYLFTIAAHLVQQHWQRSEKRPVCLEDVDSLVSPAVDPESAAISAERVEQLERKLSQLSAKVQAAVLLHHRDGYTCDEIGEKLSVVRHRVKKYLVRGLSHCRTLPATDFV